MRRARPTTESTDRDRALALIPVSRETTNRLDQIVSLLLTWQEKINLIAPSTVPSLWTRHVADSLQLLALAPDARIWVDLGSGGGFPGLPIACALAEIPETAVHLVESNSKKAAFLREAVRVAQLPAMVHAERIERFVRHFRRPVDVVTARAVAALPQLFAYAQPLLERGAQGLFPKGQDVGSELTAAAKCWNIEASLVPSRTDTDARIAIVRKLAPRKK
jgi:16S rRNA (guanine527-N7)-methyltransferase